MLNTMSYSNKENNSSNHQAEKEKKSKTSYCVIVGNGGESCEQSKGCYEDGYEVEDSSNNPEQGELWTRWNEFLIQERLRSHIIFKFWLCKSGVIEMRGVLRLEWCFGMMSSI